MVLSIAAAGFYLGMRDEILVWAVITLTGYAALALVAPRADRTEASRLDVASDPAQLSDRAFRQRPGLGSISSSLGCGACQIDQFPMIKAIVLLLAIAATALIASLAARRARR